MRAYGHDYDECPGCKGRKSKVIWHAMAMLQFTRTHPDGDDRPPQVS